MMSIYQYQEPHEFLKDAWELKRKTNSSFTIRAWAQHIGIKNHTFLHDMVKGRRKVPKSQIPRFIQSLNLNANEGLYFESMVDLSRAKSMEEKTLYIDRMKALAPNVNKVTFTELESFRMLKDPIHFFISEMVMLPDFNPDPAWIQKRLVFDVSQETISKAIERLILLDVLREDPQGRLIRVDSFIASKSDVKDLALQEYHKNLSDMAKRAIEVQNVLEREFQGMTLNFDIARLPEAKQVIRKFVTQFLGQFDQTTSPTREVYHMNLQFFRITQNTKTNKGEKE